MHTRYSERKFYSEILEGHLPLNVQLARSGRKDHTCIYERTVIASARRQDLAREDSVA
jgi:hypothetical protein